MEMNQTPIVKDLVLVGGGHSHVTVLRGFGMAPMPGVRVTLISADLHAPYSGMLPGLVAGHYDYDEVHIDLAPLAQFANARFIHAKVSGLDPEKKLIHCQGRPSIQYDIVSINVGSAPNTAAVPGADEYCTPVKPIQKFYARFQTLYARVLDAHTPVRIGVVGGGAGGVEILLAIQYRLKQALGKENRSDGYLSYHLITDEADILFSHNAQVRRKFRRIMTDCGITLHLAQPVVEVLPGQLLLAGGGALDLDEILWVTEAVAPPWLGDTGFQLNEDRFLYVDESLRSLSHSDVFAAGDCAAVQHHPRPKAGVFAVRQGQPLTANLRRALLGWDLEPFKPQKRFLSLISTGGKSAVASRGPWAIGGRLMWAWKDWIDRRFMDRFNLLPEMPVINSADSISSLVDESTSERLAAHAMRCGGCGAKVGSAVLERVLDRLPTLQNSDIVVGLIERDDAAVVVPKPDYLSVHTVDGFPDFISDPYVFGKIAANHALNDIYAMGAMPRSALAIVAVPYGPEDKMEDLLFQLLSGASHVLQEAGAVLVGGHTSEGTEIFLGFSVNGFVKKAQLLRKCGMRPGNKIILTKAIGTGMLFAAHMRHKANGRWIAGALDEMLRPNGRAAEYLKTYDATACTDVSGFGLLGHLSEMAQLSEVRAILDDKAIPLLEGVADIVPMGIRSSLHEENLRCIDTVLDRGAAVLAEMHPKFFDPQTSGGLLASVPPDTADACIEALHDDGYPNAAIIGTVIEPNRDARLIEIAHE